MSDKLNRDHQPQLIDHRPQLILASASPRRAALLAAAGIDFTVRIANVDETLLGGEAPEAYVERLARAKAAAAASAVANEGEARAPADEGGARALVLGADTTVVIGSEVAGKPVDVEDAERMLRALAGNWHEVLTGIALARGEAMRSEVVTTRVKFAELSAEEIAWYARTGEPDDKAGAYAIQGLASLFIERIEGDYSNVVGLPVQRVYQLAKEMGVDLRAR